MAPLEDLGMRYVIPRFTFFTLLLIFSSPTYADPSTDLLKSVGCEFTLPKGYTIDKKMSSNKPNLESFVLVWAPGGEAEYKEGSFVHFGSGPHARVGTQEELLKFYLDDENTKSIKVGQYPGYLRTKKKGKVEVVTMGVFVKGRMHALICQGTKAQQVELQKLRDSLKVL